MIKKLIPNNVKLKIHLIKNSCIDIYKGYFFRYAKKAKTNTTFSNKLTLAQDLKPNDAKKHNLLLAIKAIESVQINPNELFSFFKIVGNPSKKNGFLESRSIVNGTIENSIGGGLCQLSGLIYHISLMANLKIIERHNHSIDIYTDETRFTPLGSDATVAYGYKDLKISNNLTKPIKFTFLVTDTKITIQLNYSDKIEPNKIQFKKQKSSNNKIEVATIINDKIIAKSVYKKLS